MNDISIRKIKNDLFSEGGCYLYGEYGEGTYNVLKQFARKLFE